MTRVVVVGSGAAGLTTALDLAARRGVEVTLVANAALDQSSTGVAQGGVAVVTSADDTVSAHVTDTLVAGAGLCADDAVRVLCAGGLGALRPSSSAACCSTCETVSSLAAWRAPARTGGSCTRAVMRRARPSRRRSSLESRTRRLRERTTVIDVVVVDGRAAGVRLLGGEVLPADAVVLATGAAGQLFSRTTNPPVVTVDGVEMAIRAGAIVADLEFHRFHPAALATPGNHLVSEAVRGGGAVLVDAEGGRFMIGVHQDAELAPRDVVARGIAEQMTRQGGVRTVLWGRTSLPGLFAVGAVACTGLHGANRLASNSLLEGGRDRGALQGLMWSAAGRSRDPDRLSEAAEVLASWAPPPITDVTTAEDATLWLAARAVVASALIRRESRGAYFRRDFPQLDPLLAIHSTVKELSRA